MSVNVPSGYKQTKVGVIPEDWDVVKIRDIATVKSGSTPLRSNNKFFLNGSIPWVKTTDLTNSLISNTEEKITDYALRETSIKIFPINSILVAMYGGFNQIGRTGLLKVNAASNQALSVLILKENIDARYILEYLNHRVFYWQRFAASSRKDPNITKSDVEVFPIVLPSLKEQQKIAQILTTWDDAITKQEALIKAKEALKKGLMQKLLSGEWEEVKLGDIAKINPKNNNLPETFVYIDLKSVKNGTLLKESIINSDNAPSRAQRLLEKDDILYQTVRPYQKNNFFFKSTGNYVASTGYAQIRALESSEYLYHYLHWDEFVSKVLLRCTGTSYPAINSTDLSKIKIKLPPLKEQQKIAEVVTLADKEIDLLKNEREALKEQKRGLMQRLLSGGVRVI